MSQLTLERSYENGQSGDVWIFRCDSISKQFPLWVSGSVGQWVIVSDFPSLLAVVAGVWTQVDPSGLKWTQVDPSEPKQTQADPSGPKRAQLTKFG